MEAIARPLKVEQADITTATIEVRVLKVSGKNLTLSVFRQIPERDILNDNYDGLRGVPWGIVNYFWGDKQGFKGMHVLWQDGGELFRSYFHRHLANTSMADERRFAAEDWKECRKTAMGIGAYRTTDDGKYVRPSTDEEIEGGTWDVRVARKARTDADEAWECEKLWQSDWPDIQNNYNRLHDAIAALPQLYIAI